MYTKVHPHVEAKIVEYHDHDSDSDTKTETGDIEENLCDIGQAGELWTRGYCVMKGYWGQPEKTDEAIVDGLVFYVPYCTCLSHQNNIL